MQVKALDASVALQPLIERSATSGLRRGGVLPADLRERYGGDLAVPLRSTRPTVVANFVSTLDGVVSYNTPEAAGGGEISGFFEPDRFVMGLLRALADAVLVGAGTLRAAPSDKWTPGYIHPPSGSAYAELRERLHLPPVPLTVVVSASGDLDLAHPGLADASVPVLLVTSDIGRRRLGNLPAHIEVETAKTPVIDGGALLDLLARRGLSLVLCEGGPRLLGHLLSAGLVDELFLTLAPQIAGRSTERPRSSLIEGVAFQVADAPWAELVDLRRAGDHLFTRYRTKGSAR